LVAFTLLTGARDGAIASFKLKHVDLAAGCVHQDAREVRTKFSKTFITYFLPVGGDVLGIVTDWVRFLREERLWSNDDPLFPATRVTVGEMRRFEAVGLARAHWSSAAPIRAIFREAFNEAGLPYFNPHSFRKTLVQLGSTVCQTPEEFKAWSQNLGHEGVLTTFYSYGEVGNNRQGEIIKSLAHPKHDSQRVAELAKALVREMRESDLEASLVTLHSAA
jgi:integrase